MGATYIIVDVVVSRFVSSHAPVWGQPIADILGGVGDVLFQVMPLYGGNQPSTVWIGLMWWFQVMPPYGGNIFHGLALLPGNGFKSCPRMGATQK